MDEDIKIKKDHFNLNNGFYIPFNTKALIHLLGVNAGLYLAEMFNQWTYFKESRKDGFFWFTQKQMTIEIGLTRKAQSIALDKLQKLGYVEVQRKGVPAKNYFKLNEQKIYAGQKNILDKLLQYKRREKTLDETSRALSLSVVPKGTTRCIKKAQLDASKGTTRCIKKAQHTNTKRTNTKKTNTSSLNKFKEDGIFEPSAQKVPKRKILIPLAKRIKPIEQKLLKYWNSKGKPFALHRVGNNTSTEKRIYRLLRQKLDKGISPEEIMLAMNCWHDLLRDGSSPINPNSAFFKQQSLVNFLSPNDRFKSIAMQHRPPLEALKSRSPFELARKGYASLLKHFMRRDKNPGVTEKILSAWESVMRVAPDVNDLRLAAEKWVKIDRDMSPRGYEGVTLLYNTESLFRGFLEENSGKGWDSGVLVKRWFWNAFLQYLRRNEWID